MDDRGEVKFDVDLAAGIVKIGVRPPLGIAPVVAELPVMELLDKAALITLEMNKQARLMMAELARGGATGTAGARG